MNRYIFIHRLTGPAVLLLLGVVALLSQAHLASFNIFVPLLLILLGVLKLAERAALAQESNFDPYGNPYSAGGGYSPYNPYGTGAPQQPYPPGASGAGAVSTAIAPSHQNGSENDEGKQ
jgi:hypothetical protein